MNKIVKIWPWVMYAGSSIMLVSGAILVLVRAIDDESVVIWFLNWFLCAYLIPWAISFGLAMYMMAKMPGKELFSSKQITLVNLIQVFAWTSIFFSEYLGGNPNWLLGLILPILHLVPVIYHGRKWLQNYLDGSIDA